MSADFDPYREWLGIEPHEHPVNHYRLLGVAPLTNDAEAIRRAADARMAEIRQYQMGRRGSQTQPILNALSMAKLCLLNPNTKATYDAVLQAQSSMPSPPALLAPAAPPGKSLPVSEQPVSEPPVETSAPPVPPPVPTPAMEPPLAEPPTASIAVSPIAPVVSGRTEQDRSQRGSGLLPIVSLVGIVLAAAGVWFAFSLRETSRPPASVVDTEQSPAVAASPVAAGQALAPADMEGQPLDERGEPVVTQQEGGGQIQFRPAAAQLHGKLNLKNIESRDAIVGWTSSADRAVWRFHLTQPGAFHLRLEYASAISEPIGTYDVRVADQTKSREVRPGDGTHEPVADEFPLALRRGGDYELEIIPQSVVGSDLFTLYSVELSPVGR